MCMTQKKNKFTALFLMLATIITSLSVFAMPASADDGLNLAFDVMYVIDTSYSMGETDPGKIAQAACNLFTDMCDHNQARAGYVGYAKEIHYQYPLVKLETQKERDDFKSKINSLEPLPAGATDISLGLTKAKNMLIEGQALGGDRSPMIILFSDGNATGLSEERLAVYDEELKDTLKFLSSQNIPVYTVAIENANTNTDTESLRKISEATNAPYFVTDNASDLSNILSQIMAHRLRSNMTVVEEIVATGDAQTVEINIPNDSIYQANIIMFSSKGVSNLHLSEPSGNEVVIPSNKVIYSRSQSYDLIKLIRPAKGIWELTLTGVEKDKISINLINCYDLMFGIKSDKTTITNGDAATFEIYCDSMIQGESSETIFDNAEGTLTITNVNDSSDTQKIDLVQNDDKLSVSHTFNKAGTYSVVAEISNTDDSFTRETSAVEIEVKPYPLKLVAQTGETSDWCFSPFLGIKIKNKLEFPLVNSFSWDPDAVITVIPTPGGWEDVCDVNYDETTNIVTVSAEKSGNATIVLGITDSYGQSSSYTIKINVIPGWVPFIVLISIVALIVALILIIRKVNEPRIKGKLKISVALPSELASMTPPEAEIDLSIMNKKGKVPMMAILASNLTLGGMYTQVLEGIAGFVSKIALEAANKDCSSLYIHIPIAENGGTVQFNNAVVEKKAKKTISVGMPAVLNYSLFNGAYVITFNFIGEDWGNGWDTPSSQDPFGGGSGGFGGFGGNSSGGFGGFDSGSSSNAGFGGFGGFDSGSNGGAGFGTTNNGAGNQNFGGFDNNANSQGFGSSSSSAFGGFDNNDNSNSFNAF